jgi:hypothetical protein
MYALKHRAVLPLLVLLAVALSACSQSDPTPSPQSQPQPTPTLDSPLAISSPLAPAFESPLPSQAPTPTRLPPPAESKGSITGRIINAATGQEVVGISIYLGTIQPMGSDGGQIVTMREKASPQTLSNIGGYFAIRDVEPGVYALILWTPFNSVVVPDPVTGQEFLITVEDGKITELGDVVSNLP